MNHGTEVAPADDVSGRITVRPMTEADVEPAWACALTSLVRMSEVYEPVPAAFAGTHQPSASQPSSSQPSADQARGYARVRHLLGTDPGGAWVAVDPAGGAGPGRESTSGAGSWSGAGSGAGSWSGAGSGGSAAGTGSGGRVVGTALALVRGGLWFLSLLAVETGYQSQQIGRRLLDAALTHSRGASAGWILSSADPKALRRYQAAGFHLHPGYLATGTVDRAAIPAGLGVRDGDWARDRELVDDIVTGLRGAPYGPDLDLFEARGDGLKIVDGEGYAIGRPRGVTSLGARRPEVARRLLWDALAAATEQIELEWLVAGQQWAIDLALAGRLSLYPGPSSCLRGVTTPMAPFLPSGAFG